MCFGLLENQHFSDRGLVNSLSNGGPGVRPDKPPLLLHTTVLSQLNSCPEHRKIDLLSLIKVPWSVGVESKSQDMNWDVYCRTLERVLCFVWLVLLFFILFIDSDTRSLLFS